MTRFCAATSTTMPSDRGQQQRVVLAVRRPRAAPARARTAAPRRCRAAQKTNVSTSVRSSRRSAPEMTRRRRRPTARSPGRSRRRARRAPAAARRCRARSASAAARPAARRSAPPSSAMSGDSAAQSMCGRLGVGCASGSRRRPPRCAVATSLGASRPAATLRRRVARERSSAELRVEREREDRPAPAATSTSPSRSAHLARLDARPDAVVHRADEQPQHVDRRPARRR